MGKISNAVVNFIFPDMTHFLYKQYIIGLILLVALIGGYFLLLNMGFQAAYISSFIVMLISAYLGYKLPKKNLKSG